MTKHIQPFLIRFRKEWKNIIFWFAFPIIATFVMMKVIGFWQEETTIPIGVVQEDESALTNALLEQMENTELLRIEYVTLEEGLHLLSTHQLDSVYVIRDGYEENVLKNRRNRLIEAYSSNQSFAYRLVKEIVTSYAQEDVARSKAAFVIKNLYVQDGIESEWNYDEIIERSKERQQKADLLNTTFAFQGSVHKTDSTVPIIQVLGIWALFSLMSTFFVFDWLLKDQKHSIQVRWLFTAKGFRYFALQTFIFYSVLLFSIDYLALWLLSTQFTFQYSLVSVMMFRLTMNIFVFYIADRSKHLWMYYVKGCLWSIVIALLGGALIPIDGVVKKFPLIQQISPVNALLNGRIAYIWTLFTVILLFVWYLKTRRRETIA